MKFLVSLLVLLISSVSLSAGDMSVNYSICERDDDCDLIEISCSQMVGVNKSLVKQYKEEQSRRYVNCSRNSKNDPPKYKDYFRVKCVEQICKPLNINSVRAAGVPSEVLSPCRDSRGLIADRHEKFNHSDVIDGTPRARLILACHNNDGSWYIRCEKGGYTLKSHQFKFFEDSKGKWTQSGLSGKPLEFCP